MNIQTIALSGLIFLGACCERAFPILNASSEFTTLVEAKSRFGVPADERVIRRDQLPSFDPSSDAVLRNLPADQAVVVTTWKHSCWTRGEEMLVVVSMPSNDQIIAVEARHDLWR